MEQAVDLFKNGERVILCEYRFGKGETINYRDKKTGAAASFSTIRHTIEIGTDAYIVSERAPENFKPEEYKPAITKGSRCLLKYDRFFVEKGVGQFSGSLQPVVAK